MVGQVFLVHWVEVRTLEGQPGKQKMKIKTWNILCIIEGVIVGIACSRTSFSSFLVGVITNCILVFILSSIFTKKKWFYN